jgi:8-oxo-dGTP diphosphatase
VVCPRPQFRLRLASRATKAPEFPIVLARWIVVQAERATPKVIVGAAIIAAGRVLACERAHPPEAAGKWEFPGGKVEPGESELDALVRECVEELGVRVEVGDRVGHDVPMGHGRAVLKVYAARLVNGDEPQPLEHSELRWLAADQLDSITWLPADAPVVAALRPLLASLASSDQP